MSWVLGKLLKLHIEKKNGGGGLQGRGEIIQNCKSWKNEETNDDKCLRDKKYDNAKYIRKRKGG